MHKRMLAFCVAALMAFAVVPAIASASPVLTKGGTAVATGTSITAETDPSSTSFTFTGTNPAVNVVCNKVDMSGTVKTNSGTLIEGTIETATFKGPESEEKCSGGSLGAVGVTIPGLTNGGGTQHWCIKTTKPDAFEIAPAACGTAGGSFTFVLDTAIGTCNYTRSTAITGTYTTTEPTTLTIASPTTFTKEGGTGGIFCPAEGHLDGSLILPGFKIS